MGGSRLRRAVVMSKYTQKKQGQFTFAIKALESTILHLISAEWVMFQFRFKSLTTVV